MTKIKSDNSDKFSDWTTKKLKIEATMLHSIIFNSECYGTHDLFNYEGIMKELESRGVKPKEQIYFD